MGDVLSGLGVQKNFFKEDNKSIKYKENVQLHLSLNFFN